KVLPAHLSQDEERRRRFQREARLISNLSHANICTLFDVGSHDNIDFLLMELLEGESLSHRLEQGPLGTEQVLRYGIQIAEALEAAHRQRPAIVHRDLKPGNIMLTKGGAKLLDFGLATYAASPSQKAALSSLATADSKITDKNVVVGTFQYMAPEHLEGSSQAGVPVPVAIRRRWRERAAWASVAVLALATVSLAVGYLRRAPVPPPAVRFTIDPPQNYSFGYVVGVTLSPDAQQLAFVAQNASQVNSLWVRSLNSALPRLLEGTENVTQAPLWSYDGKSILFVAGTKLQRVTPDGGP